MKRLFVYSVVSIISIIAWVAVWAQTLTPTSGGSGSGTVGNCASTGGVALYAVAGTTTSCNTNLNFNGNLNVGNSGVFFAIGGSYTVNDSGNTVNLSRLDGANGASLSNNLLVRWNSTSNLGGSFDTGISRSATPGVIDIGNGSAGNTSGGFVTATATLTSLTTGTNADFLCLGAGGTILIQNSACTISSLRFKPDWKPYHDDAMAKVAKLDVGTFHLQSGPNADPNVQSLQAGLSAENVAAIAPECAIYETDMKTPKSYRQECVIALLVKAIQQLKK